MSESFSSLKTNSLTTPTISFFDTGSSSAKFWQTRAKQQDFYRYPKIIEGEFKIRNKTFFKQWESCVLSIYESHLVFKKKKNDQYVESINLNEKVYRLQTIIPGQKSYSSKYPDSFSLYSNGKTMEFFCNDKTQFAKWFDLLKKFCILANFPSSYQTTEILGRGGYGMVYAIERLSDKRRFAGKFIKFSPALSKDRQRAMIINEIKMLRRFEHSQIVKLYEVYEMTGQVCLVMELVQGNKLFDLISERQTLPENTAAYIMKQILLILCQLEAQDIIHRDIKAENILYTIDDNRKINLKLIDFGLATTNKHRDMIRKCGTAGYIAPEILNDSAYDFKADLYSAGVIMYICLTGRPLFYGRDYEDLLLKNRSGVVKYRGSTWNRLSHEAQDLLKKLLEPIPSSRISLSDALNHEWFMQNIAPEDRQDLVEHIFKVVKLNIPEEINISKVPTSFGQLPYIRKTNAFTQGSLSSNQKNISGSFFTSTVALGIDENKELHPFYRIVSNEASNHSQVSISITNSFVSGMYSRNFSGFPGTTKSIKRNTLGLPAVQGNSPQRPNQPVKPTRKISESYRLDDSKYNIQVSIADSFDGLEVGYENEGSLCSTMYEDLKRKPLRFARLTGRRPGKSATDVMTVNQKNSLNKRYETQTGEETPRNKFKVVAVNSEVRKQITESFC